MKKTRRCAAGALALMLTLSGCGGQQTQEQSETGGAKTLAQAQSAYLEHVDLEYSYELAKRLEEIRSNPVLGYRTAGSDAEYQTGELLKAEMESIGLSDVTKDAFTLDTWTFETAPVLGYRTAGSDAEYQTGELLKAEMESIGLSDVTKDAFTLDTWTFETA